MDWVTIVPDTCPSKSSYLGEIRVATHESVHHVVDQHIITLSIGGDCGISRIRRLVHLTRYQISTKVGDVQGAVATVATDVSGKWSNNDDPRTAGNFENFGGIRQNRRKDGSGGGLKLSHEMVFAISCTLH
jgi:hypothetical protein